MNNFMGFLNDQNRDLCFNNQSYIGTSVNIL